MMGLVSHRAAGIDRCRFSRQLVFVDRKRDDAMEFGAEVRRYLRELLRYFLGDPLRQTFAERTERGALVIEIPLMLHRAKQFVRPGQLKELVTVSTTAFLELLFRRIWLSRWHGYIKSIPLPSDGERFPHRQGVVLGRLGLVG